MKSMTGYGFREITEGDITVSAEIKSYNSRFLDLYVNLPPWLGRLESRLREFSSARVQRGKVELTLRLKERSTNVQVVPDAEVARAYLTAIAQISAETGVAGDITLPLLLSQEGVLRSERVLDPEAYWAIIERALTAAFADFDSSRAREGAALEKDLVAMIERVSSAVTLVGARAAELEKRFTETVRSRFAEVLGNAVDEQRVLQEVAALLVKYTINEELVRLASHLDSLREELRDNPSPGRKADFICQEINREINTIGSKNQAIEIGRAVIDAKDALENIREQLRNIE